MKSVLFLPLLLAGTVAFCTPIWNGRLPSIRTIIDKESEKPTFQLNGDNELAVTFQGCKAYQGIQFAPVKMPANAGGIAFSIQPVSGAMPTEVGLREWFNDGWEDFTFRLKPATSNDWQEITIPLENFRFSGVVNRPDSNKKIDRDKLLLVSLVGRNAPGVFRIKNLRWILNTTSTADSAQRSLPPIWNGQLKSLRIVIDKKSEKPSFRTGEGNTLLVDLKGCREYQGVEFPPVRMPQDAGGVAFSIRLVSGEAPTEIGLREWFNDGWEDFTGRFQTAPDGSWTEVEIPLERFSFSGVVNRPDSNKRIDRDKHFLFSFISRGAAGTFEIKDFRWTRKPQISRHSVNLLPGDSDFETGAGGWLPANDGATFLEIVQGDAAVGRKSLLLKPDGVFLSSFLTDLLEPETRYTFSLYVKGTRGKHGSVRFQSSKYKVLGSKDFIFSGEWERITVPVTTGRQLDEHHLIRLWCSKGGNMRIDALQLEEGDRATPFVNGEALSLHATTGAPGEILFQGQEPSTIRVTLHNNALGRERFPLKIRLFNGKTLIAEQSVDATDKLHQTRFDCPFARECGYYFTTIKVVDRAEKTVVERHTPFVVTRPFTEPVDEYFGIQKNWGVLPREALRRIGISWVRTNSLTWDETERKGPIQWNPSNTPAARRQPGDFNRVGTIRRFDLVPPWARDNGTWAADPRSIQNFIEYTAHVEGDTISAYEMSNEPDVMLSTRNDKSFEEAAAYYVSLLKVCYPLLAGRGRPVVVNSSGGRPGVEMMEYVFRHAADCFDLLAVHPYTFPRELADDGRFCATPEIGGMYGALLEYREMLRKYAPDHQLAIGELGWSLSDFSEYDSPAARRHAAFLARTFLLAKTIPEIQWILWFSMINMPEGGRFNYGIWRDEYGPRPLPAVAAYTQVARAVNGMEGAATQLLDGEIRLLQWRQKGRDCFALWTIDEHSAPVTLELAEATVTNLFGTPEDPRKFSFSELPVYITADAGRGEAVKAALLKQLEERIPLQLTIQAIRDNLLRVHLRNNLNTPWDGTISADGAPLALQLDAKKSRILELPLQSRLLPGKANPVNLTFREKSNKTFHYAAPLPAARAIPRRDITDWKSYPFLQEKELLILNTRKDIYPPDPGIKWKGPEDLSGKFFLAWDQDAFYLMAEITDDEHNNPFRDEMIWAGDSIQFAFDTRNDALPGTVNYNNNDYDYGVAAGKQPWCWHAPEQKLTGPAGELESQISREGNRTVYRIRIPWTRLAPLSPEPGRIFGFAMVIRDRDGESAPFFLSYGGDGIANGKNPALFRKMILTE